MSNEIAPQNHFSFGEVERMATAVAKSGLFGVKTPEQALALFLLAQSEGIHPMCAARDYHIISGRPSMKAETMLARFQVAGGTVIWNEYSDTKVSGTFSHPSGSKITISWDIEKAKKNGLATKDIWKNYPAAMLRSRVISEAIRTVYPGVLSGLYSPEEMESFSGPVVDADTSPTYIEPREKVSTPPVVEKSKQETSQKENPPTATVTSPMVTITPEEAQAVKQKWNAQVQGLPDEIVKEGAAYLKERFGFRTFEQIRPEQLLDVLMAFEDIKAPGTVDVYPHI